MTTTITCGAGATTLPTVDGFPSTTLLIGAGGAVIVGGVVIGLIVSDNNSSP